MSIWKAVASTGTLTKTGAVLIMFQMLVVLLPADSLAQYKVAKLMAGSLLLASENARVPLCPLMEDMFVV
jgi:hypothetical protein